MNEHMEVGAKATRDKQGFWRNLTANVKGPAVSVVLVVWIVAIVIASIYKAYLAIAPLSLFIGLYFGVLGSRSN